MNKIFTRVIGGALGLAMAVGVGASLIGNVSKKEALATDYDLLASYTFTNTRSTTAATSGSTVKGWFTLGSGSSIISSIANNSLVKVYPGANGGSNPDTWEINNALKIGASKDAGSIGLTMNSGITVDKVSITGYGWKDSLVVTAGGISCTAGAFNLANKENVVTNPNPSTIDFEATSLTGGVFTISTNNTSIVITGISFYKAKASSTYTLTYNDNGSTGGSIPAGPTSYNAGTEVTVLDNTNSLVKSHYAFSGWNTLATGQGTDYAAGSKITMDGNKTLFAKWTQNEFKVTYNSNGGSGSTTDNVWHPLNSDVTVKVSSYTAPASKVFSSWNTAKDGSGTTYYAGGTIENISSDITLYAQWVVDPAMLSTQFLEQCKSTSDISYGGLYVIAAFHSNKTYLLGAPTQDLQQIAGTLCESSWTDTFGSDTVKTMRTDLSAYSWIISGSASTCTLVDINGKYLGHANGDDNKTSFTRYSEETSTHTQWNISSGSSGATFRIKSKAATTRGIILNSSNTFGAYATSNVDGSSYFDVEIYRVVSLSGITKLSITCDGKGGNSADWSSLKTSFEGISKVAWKAYYKHAAYTITGEGTSTVVTAAENTDSDIALFVSQYDYMAHKYEHTGENDFIQRLGSEYDLFKANENTINRKPALSNNANSTMIVVIVISSISLVALGGFLVIRRKKEQ